jgi:hypothetical protein
MAGASLAEGLADNGSRVLVLERETDRCAGSSPSPCKRGLEQAGWSSVAESPKRSLYSPEPSRVPCVRNHGHLHKLS